MDVGLFCVHFNILVFFYGTQLYFFEIVQSFAFEVLLGSIMTALNLRLIRPQKMTWLDDISDSMDMSLSKLKKLVRDREGWRAAVHGVTKIWTQLSD